jgi:hypothetical protein
VGVLELRNRMHGKQWMLAHRGNMERKTAETVIELMLRHGQELDESVRSLQGVVDAREFERYRKAVGRIMGEMLLEVMNPVFAEHPDLKPPQLL